MTDEIGNIIRAEGSASYWSRPDSVSVGARAAWDYFVAEEKAKESTFDRRLPALMFYGRTDRTYWFMQFRNREIEKVTPAEVKAARKRTRKLLKKVAFKKTIVVEADDTTLADVREALVYTADMLEQVADMKEQRDANPKLRTKNRFENAPSPEFSRAQASRLLRTARHFG